MKEALGIDIFDKLAEADCVCIPTNCSISTDGTNPMGALAGAFAKRWDELPGIYGELLCRLPNVPVILGWVEEDLTTLRTWQNFDRSGCALVAFPTMHDIRQPASLPLIIRSARLLAEMADLNNWQTIYLPAVGCGVGGLSYQDQIVPELSKILDQRFCIIPPREK
jgi:hypothetical protein